MGPLAFAAVFVLYGALYILFAFREPPQAAIRFFKIPSIFVFLPDQHQVRVGRIAVGLLFVITPFFIAFRVLFWTP
jgi:hypothetical protein